MKRLILGVAEIKELGIYFNCKERDPMHLCFIYDYVFNFTSRNI